MWPSSDCDVFGATEPLKGIAAKSSQSLRTKKRSSAVERQAHVDMRPDPRAMNPLTSPLLTDLYHLNMIQAYLDHRQTYTAVFEFFVRKLPPRRGFLLAAGLEQALDFLEALRFTGEEIQWLARTGRFKPSCSITWRSSVSPATCMPFQKDERSSKTSRSCA